MVLRFDSNGLLWFFTLSSWTKIGFSIFRRFDKLQRDQDSASRARFPQFSKVINFRLCRIGKETFSAKTSFGALLPMVVLVSNFPQPRGGDLFWIYALDFRRVLAVFIHEGGLCRILFKLLMNGGRVGLGSSSPSVKNGSRIQRSQARGRVRLWTSAITFLMPDQERVSNDEPEEDGCAKT